MQTGDLHRAKTILETALAANANDREACVLLGNIHKQCGEVEKTIACWKRALAIRFEPETALELGRALGQLGHHTEAIDILRRAIAQRTNWPEALTQLGIALGSSGQPSEALPAFRAAVELTPDLPPAQHNLGVALIQCGQVEEGAEALRLALRLEPKYPEAHFRPASGGLKPCLTCRRSRKRACPAMPRPTGMDCSRRPKRQRR